MLRDIETEEKEEKIQAFCVNNGNGYYL